MPSTANAVSCDGLLHDPRRRTPQNRRGGGAGFHSCSDSLTRAISYRRRGDRAGARCINKGRQKYARGGWCSGRPIGQKIREIQHPCRGMECTGIRPYWMTMRARLALMTTPAPAGAKPNRAKFVSARGRVRVRPTKAVLTTWHGMGYARQSFKVDAVVPPSRCPTHCQPVSEQLILSFIAERVGCTCPKSY